MTICRASAVIIAAVLTGGAAGAQRGAVPSDLPKVNAAAALASAVPDLQERIARFKPVKMPFNAAGLSARKRQMVDQFVIACSHLESM